MSLPPKAWVIALATAMQESGLRNLGYGDRDSLGLFQQRPSQGGESRRRSPTRLRHQDVPEPAGAGAGLG